jgi:hypothetical protein
MANEALIQFDGGVLVADCIAGADASNDIELTQYPIETGSTINDHAITKPFTLELTLVQTETPVAADGFRVQSVDLESFSRPRATQQGRADVPQAPFQLTLQGLGAAAISALGGGSAKEIRWTGTKTNSPPDAKQFKVSVLQADQEVARVNEFHDALLSLQAATELLVVTIKGQTYIDMLLTSVKRTDPQGQAGCARFTCSLQQVRTVETQTVELPPVPTATKKKSVGKTTPAEPPEKIKERERTAAHALLFGDS